MQMIRGAPEKEERKAVWVAKKETDGGRETIEGCQESQSEASETEEC